MVQRKQTEKKPYTRQNKTNDKLTNKWNKNYHQTTAETESTKRNIGFYVN